MKLSSRKGLFLVGGALFLASCAPKMQGEDMVLQGRALIAEKKYEQAAAFYQRVLQEDPQQADALNGLGVVLDHLSKHEQAQTNYETALRIRPDDDKIKSNLGLSLAFSGQKEKAMTYLKPLAHKKDATDREKANYALLLVMQGKRKQAESFLGQPISENWTHKIEEEAD